MFEEEDDIGKSHEQIRQMPIYKKGLDMLQLADKIAALVTDEDYGSLDEAEYSLLKQHAEYLRGNAMLINPKIAGAEGVAIYDLCMENAAIIRKAARELLTDCTGLKMYGFKHTEYLELLRNEVEEFRILFAEWVKAFDIWNYNIDRWGLFNPPGINYDDIDPDDDVPFNPNDFFDSDK